MKPFFLLAAFFTAAFSPCARAQSGPVTAPSFGVYKNTTVLASLINNPSAAVVSGIGSTALSGSALSKATISGNSESTAPFSLLSNITFATGLYSQVNQSVINSAYYYMAAQLINATDNIGPKGTVMAGQLGAGDNNYLQPGIYTLTDAQTISNTLTLNDGGNPDAVYIFRISGPFSVISNVIMSSGGTGKNVFWQVTGGATTLNSSLKPTLSGVKAFPGNIISDTIISVDQGTSVTGRLFSLSAVTLANSTVTITIDSDGDGIPDFFDDFPLDKNKSFINLTQVSTIAFEDLWPHTGDYDMNDLVMTFYNSIITNADNHVVEVIGRYTLLATGGTQMNAFGIEFPHILRTSVVANNSSAGVVLEAGQLNAVAMLFTNMRNEQVQWNTIPGKPVSASKTYIVDLNLDPVTAPLLNLLGLDEYNPFIVNYKGASRREVHLPGKLPTSLADKSVFGTGDDNTIPGTLNTYKTKSGLPWALLLPVSNFQYPVETKDISLTYLKFGAWANSNGLVYGDWYSSTAVGYRNTSFIYQAPK